MTTTPVALARDLPTQRVMRAQVDDCDLAIWRGVSGGVQAWENRCPHRGMRLSYGFVRGDSLACAYHGWHYNCEAVCHYIPAHPQLDPPASIKPVTFNVVEQAGLLWVNTKGSVTVPEVPDDCVGVRSLTIDCELSVVLSAFLDASLVDESIDDESARPLTARQFSDTPLVLAYGNQQQHAVLLFFQPAKTNVVVHVVAKKSWSVKARVGLSQWCESVRRLAERRQESTT